MRNNTVRHRLGHRFGSIYVLVLAVSVLVTVIGLSALYTLRVQRRSLDLANDAAAARLCAQAAVELGLQYVSGDPFWRNTRSSGTWVANQPLGQGRFTLSGVDPNDGDLINSELDPVVLLGIGTQGKAQQKIQLRLVPGEVQGLDCLGAALHAGGDLTLSTAGETLDVNGTLVSCNGQVTNNGTITGDLDANSVAVTGSISGTVTTPAPDKQMPDNTSLFAYYQSLGTAISILSIPTVTGTYTIEDQYLSSTYNPFGLNPTDAEGVYVIDCQGFDLHILNSHIEGTLVLLNAGSACAIDGSVHWNQPHNDPATGAALPSLLVQGNMALGLSSSSLSESTLAADLNDDGDTADSWPSTLQGLVYVSGNLAASSGTQLYDGTLVTGGNCTLSSTDLTVDYRSSFFENPPSGFFAPVEMKIATGSWEKVVD
jgi:hypothetical protein